MFHRKGPSLLELARQALSSTERGYDLLAPKFDYTPFRTPDEVLVGVREALEARVPSPRTGIDLCCGTGAGLEVLRAVCTERVVGVDFSRGMLEQARMNLEAEEGVPFTLVQGDALEWSDEGGFDVLTCFGAFGHILVEDEPRFVAQVRRLLAPGGVFVFVTAHEPPLLHPIALGLRLFNASMHLRNALVQPPFHMYYLTFLLPRARELLEAEGFVVSEQRGVLPGIYRGASLVFAGVPTAGPSMGPGVDTPTDAGSVGGSQVEMPAKAPGADSERTV